MNIWCLSQTSFSVKFFRQNTQPSIWFKTHGPAFKALDQAFEAFEENQVFGRELQKFGKAFRKLYHVFIL